MNLNQYITRSKKKCKYIIEGGDRLRVDAEPSGCGPEELNSIKTSII